MPVTLNEQTRGVALVKEIVKYYAQRRAVLTFAASIVYRFVRTRPELEAPDDLRNFPKNTGNFIGFGLRFHSPDGMIGNRMCKLFAEAALPSHILLPIIPSGE